MADVELPRSIDEMPYVMVWRMDDFMPPIIGLIIGFLTGRPEIFAGLGFALSFFYRKFRQGRPENWVMHALYWWGLLPMRGHSLFNPFEREIRA